MDDAAIDDDVIDEETYHRDPADEAASRADAWGAGAGIEPDDIQDADHAARRRRRPTAGQLIAVLAVYAVAAAGALALRYWTTKMAVRSAIRDELRR